MRMCTKLNKLTKWKLYLEKYPVTYLFILQKQWKPLHPLTLTIHNKSDFKYDTLMNETLAVFKYFCSIFHDLTWVLCNTVINFGFAFFIINSIMLLKAFNFFSENYYFIITVIWWQVNPLIAICVYNFFA